MHFLRCDSVSFVSFAALIPIVLLCLLIFPSATLCATWEPVGPDGGHFIFSMTNPANADEIMAITSSPSPSNVYKSADGGTSWSKIGEIPDPDVNDASAFDFSTLYAITRSSCYRSTDGGISWSEASLPPSSGSVYCVCAHPTDRRIIYAGGRYHTAQDTHTMVFFKSTDGGQSWSASQFFTFVYIFYPYDMAISKSNPSVIYIAGRKEGRGTYSGFLFTTSDGGDTWTDISSAVKKDPNNVFNSVAVDPTDEGRVYVGGKFLYRSTKTRSGSGLSWVRCPTRRSIDDIGIDPVDPSRIYVANDGNVAVSTDYGATWNRQSVSITGSVEHIAVAPADLSKVYVSSYTGFYKSQDSGSSWDSAHDGIYTVRINAMDVDPRMILVANGRYLMSYGRARNVAWEHIVTPANCGINDILIHPDDPNIVLIIEGYG